ncbi:hypothetical protein NQ314_015937 [Rhamnusium bicolor]|uniref:Uncharacterized protein n=1 Tax=Rhamnusium bicolor TaxID=1586634 RepID=A0AAV8WXM7_9CUCU|nr:hypothetical protein NQ314_015937 [Rhamnusium bicolor]
MTSALRLSFAKTISCAAKKVTWNYTVKACFF